MATARRSKIKANGTRILVMNEKKTCLSEIGKYNVRFRGL